MELTVYRQSSKTRPDGTIVYKGEDARPYVGRDFLLVADGLGGTSSIRHLSFNKDLFDEEKLIDTLFCDIYNEDRNEEFCKYVKTSFLELFSVKDCYEENIYNIKKSGYFASRIVSAIVLHEMFYNKQVFATNLFQQISEADEKERAKILSRLGKFFAEKIKTDLCKIAKKVNLVNESSYFHLVLLGTTLCVTIFLEHANEVEAILLTAGDSRPYLWDEKGLHQLVADQEGADGGMTNYVNADKDFLISSDYFIFQKPCFLFNASDGCFDSSCFSISPLAFEKLILTAISNAKNMEDAGKSLEDFFSEYGKHDDSSTMAMKVFGYENFAQLKQAALKRLEFIQKNYLTVLPDLLDKDYVAEEKECNRLYCEKVEEIISKLEKVVDIRKLLISFIKSCWDSRYKNKIAEIKKSIEDGQNLLTKIENNITDLWKDSFLQFCFQSESEQSQRDERTVGKIKTADVSYSKNILEAQGQMEEIKQSIVKTVDSLTEFLMQNIEILFTYLTTSDFNSIKKIWEGHFIEIVQWLSCEKNKIITVQLLNEAKMVIDKYDKIEKSKKAGKTQLELLSNYNKVYYSFMDMEMN